MTANLRNRRRLCAACRRAAAAVFVACSKEPRIVRAYYLLFSFSPNDVRTCIYCTLFGQIQECGNMQRTKSSYGALVSANAAALIKHN